MHHCKLLIIDDNPAWLCLAVAAFSSDKYKIYTAGSCSVGLKQFYTYRPDCVLLDYLLPDANADKFCQKVRSSEKLERTPIIIVSGENVWELPAYTGCLADGFVLKEGDFQKTRAILEALMRRVNWDRGVLKVGDIKLKKEGFNVFRYTKLVATLSSKQFKLFYLLMQESSGFISEAELSKYLYNSDFPPDNEDSIRGLIARLRKKLGSQLGCRIKNKSRLGWIYLQPRLRR